MSLKERIIEHVKKSPFRHHYMIFVVVFVSIMLALTEMFALVGAATITQKLPDVTATSQVPHMDTLAIKNLNFTDCVDENLYKWWDQIVWV